MTDTGAPSTDYAPTMAADAPAAIAYTDTVDYPADVDMKAGRRRRLLSIAAERSTWGSTRWVARICCM